MIDNFQMNYRKNLRVKRSIHSESSYSYTIHMAFSATPEAPLGKDVIIHMMLQFPLFYNYKQTLV